MENGDNAELVSKEKTAWVPNRIYRDLVTDENDVVGLVAYGLYKRKKIEFINRFEKEFGRIPGETDLFPFHSTALLHLDEYRERATYISSDFVEIYYSDIGQQIEEAYAKKYQEEVDAMKPSWFHGIFSSLIGSALFVLFVGLIAVATIGVKTNIWSSARAVIDQIEPHPPSVTLK